MTAVQIPPAPQELEQSPGKRRRPMWLVLIGMALFLAAMLVLGNFALWAGRTNAAEPSVFSPEGAARYQEVVPAEGQPAQDHVGDPGFEILESELIGTARTAEGQVELVTFAGRDAEDLVWFCVGTQGADNSSTCSSPNPMTETEVVWGENSGGGIPFFETTKRSVMMFNAPEEGLVMYVLLDTNRYVAANVVDGASFISWSGSLGDGARMFVLDAAGGQVYSQELAG